MGAGGLQEIWRALKTRLFANTALTDKLHAGSKGFYPEPVNAMIGFPNLGYRVIALNSKQGGSVTRLWRPTVEIGIYATDLPTAREIYTHMQSTFVIPQLDQSAIESATYRMDQFMHFNSVELTRPIIQLDDGTEIYKVASEWNCRVHLKP